MNRPTYRAAVEWIATNDNVGDDSPANPDAERNVAGYLSTIMVSDLFGVDAARIARDVMRLRSAVAA